MSRPIIVQIRMSESERTLLKRLASREGVSASEYIRRLTREAEMSRCISDLQIAEFPAVAEVQNATSP